MQKYVSFFSYLNHMSLIVKILLKKDISAIDWRSINDMKLRLNGINMDLDYYKSLAMALVRLFSPFVEVVIHDLRNGTIFFIDGNLSKRQAGDPSFIDKNGFELEKIVGRVYPKISFDGRPIKSTCLILRNEKEAIGLMCINVDVSSFEHISNMAQIFLGPITAPQRTTVFNKDWQEKVHLRIHNFLKEKKTLLQKLEKSQKKEIIESLYQEGAFQETKSADYIAKVLGIGRATIFNYLKKVKGKRELG